MRRDSKDPWCTCGCRESLHGVRINGRYLSMRMEIVDGRVVTSESTGAVVRTRPCCKCDRCSNFTPRPLRLRAKVLTKGASR